MNRDEALSNWFALTNTVGSRDREVCSRDLFETRLLGRGPSCYSPNKKNSSRKRPKKSKQFGKNKK